MKQRVFMQKIRAETKRIGRIFGGAVLAAGLMLAPMKARADSLELMIGHRSSTLDIKAGRDLKEKLGLFVRARPTSDYKGKLGFFGLGDLTFNLIDSLDFLVELQRAFGTTIPRTGFQFFRATGDFSVFTEATLGDSATPDVECLVVLAYNPKLGETWKLILRAENITNVLGEGDAHNFSIQRIRIGAGLDSWTFGTAADLIEIGDSPRTSDGTLGWNLGAFAHKTF